MKLNVGCGGTPLKGYVNLDGRQYPHVEILKDLDLSGSMRWMKDMSIVEDNTFDEMLMNHVFEHLRFPLRAMEELWRVAKPDCELFINTPYGSSDNAWEDPTHVRPVFMNSFIYFSQGIYGKNSYDFGGDWECTGQIFVVDKKIVELAQDEEIVWAAVEGARNVVQELRTILRCVKPRRAPGFVLKQPSRKLKVAL